MDKMWQIIEQSISVAVQKSFTIKKQSSISGGCINRAFKVQDENYDYFVKLNDVDLLDMFEAEFEGLSEIAQSKTIAVPKPICSGLAGDSAFIVLENLSFAPSDQTGFAMMGKQLADMHGIQQATFGWTRDNTIGSSTQVNSPSYDWTEFWQTQRLGYQLNLAGQNGYRGTLQKKGDKLMEKMSGLFPDGNPKASLLHGDLWSGNMAILVSETPVIFDPAVYYGDRETDIAMTELFGGFSENFYLSYNEHYPLDPGYTTRKIFYNIYHILNHLNLFGGGYGQQAESMMDKVLSELG